MTGRVDLAVVGGGITGLAAAWEAYRLGADVVVLDAAPRVGGKLGTSTLAGRPIEDSADAFLARTPDAVELCHELGLASELVAPATGRAFVWARGALRPLPTEQLLGVPTDLDALAASGILSPDGLARARRDLDAVEAGSTPTGGDADMTIGDLVRSRLGDEVFDRLVAPLVGGIWAGDCDRLSLETATPALAEASRWDASLVRGAAAARAASVRDAHSSATATPARGDAPPVRGGDGSRAVGAGDGDGRPGPVFLTPRGGMGRLVEALADALGDRVRTGQAVTGLDRLPDGSGWRVEPTGVVADAVVVATPAFAAAPLVRSHCAPAGDTLAGIDHASMVLVTLVVPRDGIDHPLDGSGFLVPPADGRLLTTCSWQSSKWAHLAGDGSLAVLRASAGRDGDTRALDLDDDTLVDQVQDDLRQTMGLRAAPVAVQLSRWERAFPQPRPGHLAGVAAVEAALAEDAPGLAVAGAWARGVGIPACVRSGRRAASDLLKRVSG